MSKEETLEGSSPGNDSAWREAQQGEDLQMHVDRSLASRSAGTHKENRNMQPVDMDEVTMCSRSPGRNKIGCP